MRQSPLILCVLICVGCNGGSQDRKTTQSTDNSAGTTPTGGNAGQIKVDATPTDKVNSASISGPARTLEECQAQGVVWIAVADNGASPAKCGTDKLTDPAYCSANSDDFLGLYQNAPNVASEIRATTAAGLKLYAISKRDNGGYTGHFAKIEYNKADKSTSTTYRTIAPNDAPINYKSSVANCKQLTTTDLHVGDWTN